MTRAIALTPLVLCCIWAAPAYPQDAELLNRIQKMEERIRALEGEVEALRAGREPAVAAPPAEPAIPPAQEQQVAPAPQALPVYGGAAAAASKVFNPDISLVGNFRGAAGNAGNRPTPSLDMHESELGLQAIIDPYARGDMFLSFGEEGVGLEEGYITFTSLPGAMQLRVGKMRAAFGKVNTQHTHALPWVDRPLVTQNLVGGEEGISDAGLSLSRLFSAPGQIALEGSAQVFRGDAEGIFESRRRSDVSAVGRLRAYRDLTESTNLDLGGSIIRGRSAFGDGWSRLMGVDATLRWRPLRRAIYHSFVARGEFVWARTDLSGGEFADILGRQRVTPFGFYVSGDYQLNRRWVVGGRYDRSERGACLPTFPSTESECAPAGATNPLLRDSAGSVLLTYWPSEFAQIRTQLRRARFGEGRTANEAMFQLIFSMGAHGAHPF